MDLSLAQGYVTPDRVSVGRRADLVIAGHAWTVLAAVRERLPSGPGGRPFHTTVIDPKLGVVHLGGLLRDVPDSNTLVVILHGLTGSAQSRYCALAARAAEAAGFSSLRLSMRGADCSGEDILHGGLTDDLWAALASEEVKPYQRIFLLGYSVGGHIALHAAAERIDSRVCAVAAICPPLDLDAGTRAFDQPQRWLYRRHIHSGLNAIYAATARRRTLPTTLERVRRARSCRERDRLTVVPRFGFASEEDYYARASVAPRLRSLDTPCLIVASRHDPILPPETLEPAMAGASSALQVVWTERGGHVFFPADTDLGLGGKRGVERQVVTWLGRH
jgi:predicted alpha/beta-fold hydrolase